MDNKGFAITAVVYGLAILGIMIVAILMGTLSSSRNNVSQEAKAVEEFLINFNQTEITYREDGYYTVPAGETGWYRIEAFGAGTATGARGTYVTGIIYLEEEEELQMIFSGGKTEVKMDEETLLTAPSRNGSAPGGGLRCYNKQPTGGVVNVTTFELKTAGKSLIGNDAVTFSNSGCTKAYIRGYPAHGAGTYKHGLVDGLILPGTYNGTSGKVKLQRLAERDDIVPNIPRKNTKFNNVTNITINKGSNDIPIKEVLYSYTSDVDTVKVVSCGTSTSCNVPTVNIDDISILLADGNEAKNLSGWTVTVKNAGAGGSVVTNVLYDSTSTLGIPASTTGLHLSAYQPDSYTASVTGVDNFFPIHGNYYIIPIVSENLVVSAVANSADDANQLKIEPLTGESRQKWAIDMVNAPGVGNANFPGVLNATGRKEYRIMELTRYKALNIYYDENYKMNFVSASETFNSLSRNEPQLWNIFPLKDGTFAIKTVVPSFTLSEKSGFLFTKTAGDSPNNINDIMIGVASAASQSEADRNTLPTSVERFILYSLDFSK